MPAHHCRIGSIPAPCQTLLLFLFRLLTLQGLAMSWASNMLLLLSYVLECYLQQWCYGLDYEASLVVMNAQWSLGKLAMTPVSV